MSRLIELDWKTAGEANLVRVDPALARLIPEPTDEEKAALRASVEERGIYDPLVAAEIMGVLTLLDGHNRLALADEFGFPYTVRVEEEITDFAEAERWMLEHQMVRRNLTPIQRARLAEAYEKHLQRLRKAGSVVPVPHSGRTADAAAKSYGLSPTTLQRAKTVDREGSPELVRAVESGETTITEAYRTLRPKASEPEPADAEYEEVPDEPTGPDPFKGGAAEVLAESKRAQAEAEARRAARAEESPEDSSEPAAAAPESLTAEQFAESMAVAEKALLSESGRFTETQLEDAVGRVERWLKHLRLGLS